jgi:hypothetical protein
LTTKVLCTQNPFKVNLTFVGVKVWHDFKWGCDNSMSSNYNLVKDCMGLSQTSRKLYGIVITAYALIITPFIVITDLTTTIVRFTSIGV